LILWVSMNGDGSRSRNNSSKSLVKNLKTEWSLFWDSISGDFIENPPEDPFESGHVKILTLDQVKEISRSLSKSRRQVNQKIESINKEIEHVSGKEDEETMRRIHELSDQGQALSQELSGIDERLKRVRAAEEQLKKKSRPA
jgi:DNA repair exonuclease SbcCD ATPase subunit